MRRLVSASSSGGTGCVSSFLFPRRSTGGIMPSFTSSRRLPPVVFATFVIASGAATARAPTSSPGVSFAGGSGGPGNDAGDVRLLAPSDTAGVVPFANWNNSAENATDGSLTNLVASTGAATMASISWDSDGTWTAHDTPAG